MDELDKLVEAADAAMKKVMALSLFNAPIDMGSIERIKRDIAYKQAQAESNAADRALREYLEKNQ